MSGWLTCPTFSGTVPCGLRSPRRLPNEIRKTRRRDGIGSALATSPWNAAFVARFSLAVTRLPINAPGNRAILSSGDAAGGGFAVAREIVVATTAFSRARSSPKVARARKLDAQCGRAGLRVDARYDLEDKRNDSCDANMQTTRTLRSVCFQQHLALQRHDGADTVSRPVQG